MSLPEASGLGNLTNEIGRSVEVRLKLDFQVATRGQPPIPFFIWLELGQDDKSHSGEEPSANAAVALFRF